MSLVHDMSVAYALDGLDGIERLRFEGHLAQCAGCREDVDDVRDAAELLSVGIELTPPADLRAQVVALAQRPAAEPDPGEHPGTTPDAAHAPSRRRRWFG
jgi:hypothetical protein